MAGEPPIAEAMRWVSSITTVGGMMFLPALGGQWLSTRWEWCDPWLTPLALVLGVTSGFYYLMVLVREDTRRQQIARNETVLANPPSAKEEDPGKEENPENKEQQPTQGSNAGTSQADDDVNAGEKQK